MVFTMQKVRAGNNIGMLIILYIYLFNPVFAVPGFGFVNALILFALLFAITHIKKFGWYLRRFRKELFLTILMIVYAFFRTRTPGSNAADMIPDMILWVLSTMVVSIFLVDAIFSKVRGFVLMDTVLNVAFIAAVISILAMLIPPFNSFVRGIQSTVELDVSEHVLDSRFYGLATNLTSSYGYLQGVLASYCLINYSKNPFRNAVYFLSLALATAINARTGLIPIIVTVFYLVVKNRKKIRFWHVVVAFIMILAFSPLIEKIMSSESPVIASIRAFFIAIYSFVIKGDANADGGTYFNVLYDSLILPPIQDILFGAGYTLFGAFEELGMRSDIMYVNQLFIGGVVFLIIIMAYVIVFYRNLWLMYSKRFFPVLLLFMALVANFKGSPFYIGNAFTRFVMLFYFVLLFNQHTAGKKRITID